MHLDSNRGALAVHSHDGETVMIMLLLTSMPFALLFPSYLCFHDFLQLKVTMDDDSNLLVEVQLLMAI